MTTLAERRALLAIAESHAVKVRALSRQILDAVTAPRPNHAEIDRLATESEAASKRWGDALRALALATAKTH